MQLKKDKYVSMSESLRTFDLPKPICEMFDKVIRRKNDELFSRGRVHTYLMPIQKSIKQPCYLILYT